MEKNSHHVRSISFPSISHSLTLRVEEHLCRLRSSDIASTSSSSISQNLASLQDLYESVNDLLQSISSKPQHKSVDRVLDGSVRLLDICGTARDTFSQMKQSVKDLQSSLRRRSTKDSDTANEVGSYMASRKKGDKLIRKCLQDIKKVDHRTASLNEDNHIVSILSQVETITLAVFGSLLSFVSSAKPRSESSNWSVISKLKLTKNRAQDNQYTASEMVNVNVMLKAVIASKGIQDIKEVQKSLEALEIIIQGFEGGLENIFRCLIKTRVSFLNILTQ